MKTGTLKINPVVMQAFDERNGWFVRRIRNLQAFCAGLMVCLFISLGIIGYLATRKTSVPYPLLVDNLGHVLAYGYKNPFSESQQMQVRRNIVQWWVEELRGVVADTEEQKARQRRVFQFLDPKAPAYGALYAWWKNDANPFERAKAETVMAQVTSVLSQQDGSYQVEWQETVRDRSGIPKSTDTYRGWIKAAIENNQSVDAAVKNPLGVYVQEWNWSKVVAK